MSRPLKNKTGAGIKFELAVERAGEAMGATVGSRRHIKGPGDHIFLFENGEAWVVESKASPGIGACSRKERQALLDLPLPASVKRVVALKDGHLIKWCFSEDWPSNGN